MSPRTGRPTDDKKERGYRLRVSEKELEMLAYCARTYECSQAEVIRRGIQSEYEQAVELMRPENAEYRKKFVAFMNDKEQRKSVEEYKKNGYKLKEEE
jgi:hypothetical protein